MTAIAERPLDTGRPPGPPEAAHRAAEAAREHLLSLQDPAGWWKGELATNVTMDAEDLLLREFLGIADPRAIEQSARWIRSQQRSDGTWATFHGGPGELSTTVEAYVALRLAGDLPQDPHMAVAAEWIREAGGVEATRVFTRIWLALFGLWDWDRLPAMPPELIFLPPQVPFNVYDWGCWARQTVVPLTIVWHHKPSRPLPFGVDELCTGIIPAPSPDEGRIEAFFRRADRWLHRYERRPLTVLRKAALREAAEWIIARQEADGGWGGIQPPHVYSLIALSLMGYQLDHPVIRSGLAGIEGFLVHEETPEGPLRRLEACQSPVWDTALAIVALADADLPAWDEAAVRATDWLLGEEIEVKGDWAVRRPDLAPAGWAFEFANDGYPDTDDTAEILLALLRMRNPDGEPVRERRLRAAMDRGLTWLGGMQSKDGGWGAFDADNTRTLINKLPFCDFGAVIDPPSADVTAHIVEAYAALGRARDPRALRGVRWLLEHQEADGSWFGRWGANHVYGTGATVPALVEAGVSAAHPALRRATTWLLEHQNPDGGWGEDLRSYVDPEWIGRGESTASQTAWALLALLSIAKTPVSAQQEVLTAIDRGVLYLTDTQRADGTWDEDLFTGTGFPGDFYINYHLYRLVFPLTALGRAVHFYSVNQHSAEYDVLESR